MSIDVARRMPLRSPAGVAAAAAAVAGGVGAAAAAGYGLIAAGGILFAIALVVGLVNWRWSFLGLVLYVPFSGIPIIAFYAHRTERGAATLLEDFLFVIPAYLGFVLWHWSRRRRIEVGAFPVTLVLLLAVLVAFQAFNPALPNGLVAAIGAKVWLFYIPLAALAYAYVRTRGELFRLLGIMSIVALVPAVISFVEAALLYGGHGGIVYRAYGSAAAAATQEFVAFSGLGGLRRVPSTFSFSVQFYCFMSAMTVISFAWWRSGTRTRGRGVLAALVCLAAIGGAFASGQRGAILFIPVLLVLLVVLPGRITPRAVALPVVALALAAGVGLAAGVTPHAVASNIGDTIQQEFQDAVVNGARDASSLTVVGLGTGIDTSASRYAFSRDEVFTAVKGKWHEGWYVKSYLELGVVGLALVLAIFGTILWRGFAAHARLRDPRLRIVSGALLAFVLWNVVYCLKGQYFDLDPLNVYFWLFVGLLFKLPALDAEPAEQP